MNDFSIKADRCHQEEGAAIGKSHVDRLDLIAFDGLDKHIRLARHAELACEEVLGAKWQMINCGIRATRRRGADSHRTIPSGNHQQIRASQCIVQPNARRCQTSGHQFHHVSCCTQLFRCISTGSRRAARAGDRIEEDYDAHATLCIPTWSCLPSVRRDER